MTKQRIEGDQGVINKDMSTNPYKSRKTNLLNKLEASSTLSQAYFPMEDYPTSPESVISTASKTSMSIVSMSRR